MGVAPTPPDDETLSRRLRLHHLGHEEARHGLPVSVFALVVLLAPVLEHDELLILEVLEDRRLHPRTLDVRHPERRLVAVQSGEHALKRDLRAGLDTLERVALVVPPLGHELLRAANLDDGVPAGRRAGRGGGGEADLVHRGLDRGADAQAARLGGGGQRHRRERVGDGRLGARRGATEESLLGRRRLGLAGDRARRGRRHGHGHGSHIY
mmetsp:Transcript_5834/g.23619  ORF Transcript_5834/g.23619 Transcript_5834/m.23619 type:complete len:210 (+) Transcript_5834:117-746(+)